MLSHSTSVRLVVAALLSLLGSTGGAHAQAPNAGAWHGYDEAFMWRTTCVNGGPGMFEASSPCELSLGPPGGVGADYSGSSWVRVARPLSISMVVQGAATTRSSSAYGPATGPTAAGSIGDVWRFYGRSGAIRVTVTLRWEVSQQSSGPGVHRNVMLSPSLGGNFFHVGNHGAVETVTNPSGSYSIATPDSGNLRFGDPIGVGCAIGVVPDQRRGSLYFSPTQWAAVTASSRLESSVGLSSILVQWRNPATGNWEVVTDYTIQSDSGTAPTLCTPTVVAQPANSTTCAGGTTTYSTTATSPAGFGSAAFLWQVEDPASGGGWVNLVDGPYAPYRLTFSGTATDSLTVTAGTAEGNASINATRFRCIVTNACGSVTSNEATYTTCPADINCTGDITVQDIFDFLAFYFASDPRGDFNGVGGWSVQDIFDFLAAYFAGCN